MGWTRFVRLRYPQEQQQYAERREDAGIPDDIEYQLKHEIGGDLVEEAASGLDFGCVLGDSNFGKSPELRRRLRDEAIPYALELVPSKFPVVDEEAPLQEESESGSSDPDETHWKISEDKNIFSPEYLAQEVEDIDTDLEWKHIDWAEGTKETLSGDFYRTRIRVVTDRADRKVGEETGWLLIEKTTTDDDEDDSTVSVKAWICWDLDESQGRSWDRFHRRLAVVMLSHAFIATYRLEVGQDLPTFETVMQPIVREAAIQQLMENLNFDQETATEAAEETLQGFTDWRIPDL